ALGDEDMVVRGIDGDAVRRFTAELAEIGSRRGVGLGRAFGVRLAAAVDDVDSAGGVDRDAGGKFERREFGDRSAVRGKDEDGAGPLAGGVDVPVRLVDRDSGDEVGNRDGLQRVAVGVVFVYRLVGQVWHEEVAGRLFERELGGQTEQAEDAGNDQLAVFP